LRLHLLVLTLPLVAALAACGVPSTTTRLGDLGRPVDRLTTGAIPERFVVEPGTKTFNRTDEEEVMHDRVWRFLHAPHVTGWFIPRFKREPTEGNDDPRRYFRWISKTNYRSSEVRYNTVSGDIIADIQTLPQTFVAICEVIEIDRQRSVALQNIAHVEDGMDERVAQRKLDNDTTINDFVWAVRYRYESYGYALDNLLIETPHEKSIEVDSLLNEMFRHVARAEAGDFCGTGSPITRRALILAK
jgi:hypothetical protein